jgi:hypothetical protein
LRRRRRRTRFRKREEEDGKMKQSKKFDSADPTCDRLMEMISIEFDGCNDPRHNVTCAG